MKASDKFVRSTTPLPRYDRNGNRIFKDDLSDDESFQALCEFYENIESYGVNDDGTFINEPEWGITYERKRSR